MIKDVIEMKWKMSGIRGKIGSPKEVMLKFFRLALSSEKADCNISSYGDAKQDVGHPKTFNVQAYLLGKRRMHEIETQKAMVATESRHHRCKAGGPY